MDSVVSLLACAAAVLFGRAVYEAVMMILETEAVSMPFQRGRRNRPEPGPEPGPRMPMFSRWEDLEPYGHAPGVGRVWVDYKNIDHLGKHEGRNGQINEWGLLGEIRPDREMQSDPERAYYKGSSGFREVNPGLEFSHFPTPEDAENETWRAYQHNAEWRAAVDRTVTTAEGAQYDDDRYIPEDEGNVDDIDEDDEEYMWINRVVHRIGK